MLTIANNSKPIIGMLIAVELSAAKKRYANLMMQIQHRGFEIHKVENEKYTLYIVGSGAGEVAAAAACQMLISEFNVDFIVNFGVVGGLTDEMKVAKVCVVESVVDYNYDVSQFTGLEKGRHMQYDSVFMKTNAELIDAAVRTEPSLKKVICASGDKFVASAMEKSMLNEQFGADICEMEAAGILLTCDRNSVPCLMIKAVSDALTGGAEQFKCEIDHCADICLDTLDGIVENMFN